jgi:N-acyl-D-amino-acid deacylase
MRRLLFSGGTIVDGSGDDPFLADLLVEDDRISQVGPAIDAPDASRIDCIGLTLAPGFIDSHTHSDLQVIQGRTD